MKVTQKLVNFILAISLIATAIGAVCMVGYFVPTAINGVQFPLSKSDSLLYGLPSLLIAFALYKLARHFVRSSSKLRGK